MRIRAHATLRLGFKRLGFKRLGLERLGLKRLNLERVILTAARCRLAKKKPVARKMVLASVFAIV
jgi:hypothetical protein